MPVPLSRILISTLSPRSRVEAVSVGSKLVPAALGLALDRGVEAVRDQVQEHAGEFLRVEVDFADRRIEILRKVMLKPGFSARAP